MDNTVTKRIINIELENLQSLKLEGFSILRSFLIELPGYSCS